jgi:hypothetical protein
MKHAARGLMAMVLGFALSVLAFGQFSAMEQGPPGTVFKSTELTKTYPADPTVSTLAVGIAGASFALALVGGLSAFRLQSSVRALAWMNASLLNLGRRLLAWARKPALMSHFVTSRPALT